VIEVGYKELGWKAGTTLRTRRRREKVRGCK
jgi:hypothetical protein